MQKKIIIIISSAVVVIGIILLLPNTVLINRGGDEIKIDQNKLGNHTYVFTKIYGGKHPITATNQTGAAIQVHKFNIFFNVADAPSVPARLNPNKFDASQMTPEVLAPTTKNKRVTYIGGRTPSYLLSYSLPQGPREQLSEDVFLGVNRAKWSPNMKSILLTLDRSSGISSQFETNDSNIWLYDLPTDKFIPLDFQSADFFDNNTVVGIKNNAVTKYINGQYNQVGNTAFGTKNIVSNGGVIICWDQDRIVTVAGNKTYRFSGIDRVSLSSNGRFLSFSAQNKGGEEQATMALEDGVVSFWGFAPSATSQAAWRNDALYMEDNNDNLWKIIETQNSASQLNTFDISSSSIFTDNDVIYTINGGSLYQFIQP